jgi:hypothetical protein
MAEIFFTTVVRSAPPSRGGELVRLDWGSKTVLGRVPITSSRPDVKDPNPRGNTRGGRGICITEDAIHVASYDQIRTFDLELNPRSVASNGLMVGLHEVLTTAPGRVWVAATAIDAALEIDLATNETVDQYWPRENAVFQQEFGVAPMEIDKSADLRTMFLSSDHTGHPSHLHLNAVASWQDRIHALLNTRGAMVDLSSGQVVLQDSRLVGGHNLAIHENLVFASATRRHSVCIFDLGTRTLVKELPIADLDGVKDLLAPQPAKGLKRLTNRTKVAPTSDPLFVRGLQIQGDVVFAGISPATILEINWVTGELVDLYQFSDDVQVCVHGLQLRPA